MQIQDFDIIDGRIDQDWMEQFESHRFGPEEAERFITQTLPAMADVLGGESVVLPPADDAEARTLVTITPPPQKSFRQVLAVIRQDLWLSKMFVGPDEASRWTFVVER